MTRFPRAYLPRAALRLVVAACLAGLPLTVTLIAGPAYADNGHDRGNRGGGTRRGPDHRRGPPPYGGYYSQPGPYYAAPPIIVASPPYYQQPAPSLNFVFPLVVR